MCVCSTAKRRRKQARNGYRHLPPMRRPHYHTLTLEKSQRRLADKIAKEERIRQKKRKR